MSATIQGKVWVVGHDVDTDQIYHGQYLPLTDPAEMAKHAMEYVPGMESFAQEVNKGDIILAGRNFGCGSSREHAVLCLQHAGCFTNRRILRPHLLSQRHQFGFSPVGVFRHFTLRQYRPEDSGRLGARDDSESGYRPTDSGASTFWPGAPYYGKRWSSNVFEGTDQGVSR